MANRRLVIGMPVWARVPGIIALVLVGIVASTILLGAAGVGGGAGPDKHPPVQRQNQQQMNPADGDGHKPPAGSHG